MKRIKALYTLVALLVTAMFMIGMASASPVNDNTTMVDTIVKLAVVGVAAYAVLFRKSATNGVAMNAFTEGLCEKIQTALIDLLGQKAPQVKRTQVGFLQAVTSPQNTAGIEIVPVDPGNGKYKQVRIKYIQRGISTDITNVKVAGCATTLEKEPKEQIVAVTRYLGTLGLKFTESEMRKLCEADSAYMAQVINAEIDPLVVELDKAMITLQNANFGLFNPDISPLLFKDVPLLVNATKAAYYYGEALIMEDIENIDAGNVRPLVIGSGILGIYARMTGIGCCNDLGQDLSQAGNLDFFRDRFVPTILGAEHFILLIPGYVQLLTWNEYVGEYFKENDVFSHSTIVDPVTGIKFDMKWHYNDCDDFYFVQFGINWDMWWLPTNAFAAGDELEGVNFTLHYRATTV